MDMSRKKCIIIDHMIISAIRIDQMKKAPD